MVVGRVGIEHLALGQATGKKVSQRGLSGRRAQRDGLPATHIDQRYVDGRTDRSAGAQIPRFLLVHLLVCCQSFRPATSSLRLYGLFSAQPRFLLILSGQQRYKYIYNTKSSVVVVVRIKISRSL